MSADFPEMFPLFQVGAIRNTKWPPGPGYSKQWIKLSTGQI